MHYLQRSLCRQLFLAAPSPLARRPAQLGPGFPLQVRLPAKPTHFGLSAPILGRQLTSRILRPTSQKLRSIILSEGSPNRNTELLQGILRPRLRDSECGFFFFWVFPASRTQKLASSKKIRPSVSGVQAATVNWH